MLSLSIDKVEVLKPTPHPKATPINASQVPTLYYLEPFPIEKECPCKCPDHHWSLRKQAFKRSVHMADHR